MNLRTKPWFISYALALRDSTWHICFKRLARISSWRWIFGEGFWLAEG